MPNRVVKESLRTSGTCARMSAEVERHWVRAILLGADDHGCLEVTPEILKGVAYPRHKDVMEEHVMEWTSQLEALGVIRIWQDEDHTYAQVMKWDDHSGRSYTDSGKQTRNRRKTPIPPDWVRFPKTAAEVTPLYNDNRLGQGRPAQASLGPVPVPVPVRVTNDLSTNVEGTNHEEPSTNLDRPGSPRRHRNTPTDTDLILDYSTEVLNKLEGVTTQTERKDRGTLLKIARSVPRSLANKALEDTQDAHQRGGLTNAAAYFSTRITTLCVSNLILSPFAPEEKVTANA